MSDNIYRISVDAVNRISGNPPWQIRRMGDANDRLKWAREQAGFKSARSAALRHGWNPSTYASHENGQTATIPQEAARQYGKKFKVSSAWMLTGEGAPNQQNIVKVCGMIGAGAEITPEEEQVPEEGLEEVETPFPLPEDAIAFRVEGTSMWPRYDQGDLVVCRRRNRDPVDLIGEEAAIRTADGKRYLKKIETGQRKGLFDLASHNAETIPWCADRMV